MKLLSWNVNGVRSVYQKGFLRWFKAQDADIVCLQETKAHSSQLDEALLHPLGYHSYWHSAERPGYSGVVTYSRRPPLSVREGIGVPEFDRIGLLAAARVLLISLVLIAPTFLMGGSLPLFCRQYVLATKKRCQRQVVNQRFPQTRMLAKVPSP